MASDRTLRWPLLASLVGHAAIVGGIIAYEQTRPEPPPKPVEIVMAAVATSMDALTMAAEEAQAVQPDAAPTVQPVDTAEPVPVEAARPVAVDEVKPIDTAAQPPPPAPEEVQTATAEEIAVEEPVEQVAEAKPIEAKPVEAKPVEAKPVEERVETVAQAMPPPRPKPPRPAPRPRREPTPVAARTAPADEPRPSQSAPVADAPPAPASPAPPAQTAMLSAPAARPARPSGPSQSYLAALRAQLERHKVYPPAAQRRRMEGTATVRFAIARSGRVLGYQLVRSSGHALLDREVEELLQRASPLPPLPSDVDGEQLEIVVPISFFLR